MGWLIRMIIKITELASIVRKNVRALIRDKHLRSKQVRKNKQRRKLGPPSQISSLMSAPTFFFISKLSYFYNHPDESPHVLTKSLDHKIDCWIFLSNVSCCQHTVDNYYIETTFSNDIYIYVCMYVTVHLLSVAFNIVALQAGVLFKLVCFGWVS